MRQDANGDLIEPQMLVYVSDLIHLIEERNSLGGMMGPEGNELWQLDYADLLEKATRKLTRFNKQTIQQ